MMGAYAGIGSRQTPPHVLTLMERIAARLARDGWTLRSGAARGADSAFERGARAAAGAIELYLPWPTYEQRTVDVAMGRPAAAAIELASEHHPAWARCSRGARMLHARNCHIALGQSLDDPVQLVVCYTPDAASGGGTGHALRVVRALPRPVQVLDLGDPDVLERAERFVST